MFLIIKYIYLNRLRGFTGKGNFLSMMFVILLYYFSFYLISLNYESIGYISNFYALEIILIHFNRKDLSLFKKSDKYLRIIVLEYLLQIFPALFLFIIKKDVLNACFFISILAFGFYIKGIKQLTFKVNPFVNYDPLWIIVYRKYYLQIPLIVLFFIIYIAKENKNDNMFIFIVLCVAILCCLPSFSRENKFDIMRSENIGKSYLMTQLKSSLMNTLIIIFPLILFSFILQINYMNIIVFLIVPLLVIISVNLKYNYFENLFMQQMIFVLILLSSFYSMGLSFIVIPFLVRKSTYNIKMIQNVT